MTDDPRLTVAQRWAPYKRDSAQRMLAELDAVDPLRQAKHPLTIWHNIMMMRAGCINPWKCEPEFICRVPHCPFLGTTLEEREEKIKGMSF